MSTIDECLDKCDPELREAIENVIDTAGTSEAHWWILEAAGNAVLAERSKWHNRVAEQAAEIERLRDLVERAVRTGVARGWKMDKPAWAGVTRTFACGSTRAYALCREFGFDPDASTRLSDDAEPAAHDLSDADLDLLP